jgi:hypothetical protein
VVEAKELKTYALEQPKRKSFPVGLLNDACLHFLPFNASYIRYVVFNLHFPTISSPISPLPGKPGSGCREAKKYDVKEHARSGSAGLAVIYS